MPHDNMEPNGMAIKNIAFNLTNTPLSIDYYYFFKF